MRHRARASVAVAPGVPIAHARAKIRNSSTVHEIIIAKSRMAIDFNAFFIFVYAKMS